MAAAVLITGSNVGDRRRILAMAADRLRDSVGSIVVSSDVMESEPWGNVAGEKEGEQAVPFLNQVLVLETALSPEELLVEVQKIETELGRKRDCGQKTERKTVRERYESRAIDIDILFYDNLVLETQRLTIPHPLIAERGFVLEPLSQAAPGYTHPVYGKTVAELLRDFNEQNK